MSHVRSFDRCGVSVKIFVTKSCAENMTSPCTITLEE